MALRPSRLLVAHRGASAYAPEHTRAAYRLALEQGADFVEQDLAVTKDGVLVCLHDVTLDRTTNAAEVFPGRQTMVDVDGPPRRGWLANDFTREEIGRLDAGGWFAPRFAGERIVTFQEAIDLVKGRAGLFPELKAPELYAARGVDFEGLVEEALRRNGLAGAQADPATPVILQTFSRRSVQNLARRRFGLPIVLLLEPRASGRWSRDDVLAARDLGATALGPDKAIVAAEPELVAWAHQAGLLVIPYTFRAAEVPDVTAEMRQFLDDFGVDGLFTDNPDLFPRTSR